MAISLLGTLGTRQFWRVGNVINTDFRTLLTLLPSSWANSSDNLAVNSLQRHYYMPWIHNKFSRNFDASCWARYMVCLWSLAQKSTFFRISPQQSLPCSLKNLSLNISHIQACVPNLRQIGHHLRPKCPLSQGVRVSEGVPRSDGTLYLFIYYHHLILLAPPASL